MPQSRALVARRGGVLPGDPERPELPLLRASIAVGVLQGAGDGLLGGTEQPPVASPEPLRGLQDLSSFLVRMYCSFHAWHDVALLSRGLEVRQQAPNRFFVGRGHQRGFLEVPFPLSRFPGQDVALSRLGPPDTASSRGGGSFRRAAVALHVRHYTSSSFSPGRGSFF